MIGTIRFYDEHPINERQILDALRREGKDPGGLIITIILGIVGALLGGFLASALFDVNPNDGFFDISTWLSAIIGALIVLGIYRAVAGRRSSRV